MRQSIMIALLNYSTGYFWKSLYVETQFLRQEDQIGRE